MIEHHIDIQTTEGWMGSFICRLNKHAWLKQRIGLKVFRLLPKEETLISDENNYDKLVSGIQLPCAP